jgi:hypothetical protein
MTAHPALAGPNDARIEAAVDKAIADWGRFLVCTVLDQRDHQSMLQLWRMERDFLIKVILEQQVDPVAAARIAAKTDIPTLLKPLDGTAKDLVAYCKTDPEWKSRFLMHTITVPSADLKDLLAQP